MKTSNINEKFDLTTQKGLCYVLAIAIILFLLCQSSRFFNFQIVSICTWTFFSIVVFCFVWFFLSRNLSRSYFLLLLILLCAILSYLVGTGGESLEFVVKLTNYIALPIYIIFVKECCADIFNVKFFRFLSLIIALLFAVLFLFAPMYSDYSGALTLGYSNSNTTGLYLFFVEIFLLLSFYKIKFSKKIPIIMVEIFVLYLIILSQCRTAFILGVVCFILSFIPKFRCPSKIFVIICVIFPLIFYGIYLFLSRRINNFDVILLGKSFFSGREILFEEGLYLSLFGKINGEILFGLNVAQSVINTFGIIGYVLLCLFYYLSINDVFLKQQNKMGSFPIFCVVIIMLYGCTEVSIFLNGSIYAVLYFFVMMLVKCNSNQPQAHCETCMKEI